ncbi:MAG: PIN domain-containing protein [Candidatus Micrarchaeia archaeon]|jgi:predicted nucleic acid-binding protein
MMVLDTSFLVSLFLPEDDNHAKALEMFENHRNEEMLLIDTILFETLSVLNRRHGVEAAKSAYEKLVANTKLQVHYLTDAQRKEVLEQFLSQKGRLSTADMSVVHACKTALAAPLAFDKELLKHIG